MNMLVPGKPIPPDITPVKWDVFETFVNRFLSNESAAQARQKIFSFRSEWNYYDQPLKISLLTSFQDILFQKCFPKPDCKTTYDRVDACALFRSNLWSMFIAESFLNHPFDNVFKSWLHESFHAYLHFLSLRLDPGLGSDILHIPAQVVQIAKQTPIAKTDLIVLTLAKRNLIGMMDRTLNSMDTGISSSAIRIGSEYRVTNTNPMRGVGWDSYYLNVEINVENLTEVTFKKLLPGITYRRSYTTADEYIKRRMNGVAPIYAR